MQCCLQHRLGPARAGGKYGSIHQANGRRGRRAAAATAATTGTTTITPFPRGTAATTVLPLLSHLSPEVDLVGDGHEQEPLLGGRVPDSQQVRLLGDLPDRSVDVVYGDLARHLCVAGGGDVRPGSTASGPPESLHRKAYVSLQRVNLFGGLTKILNTPNALTTTKAFPPSAKKNHAAPLKK